MKRISFYLIMILLISSCDEIFEDDISNAKLTIVAPIDGLVTTKTTLTFWWNEMNDVNSYRLQIVSTCFDTILSIPFDTNLTKNKFEVSLNPGRYEWRVKALNSATETAWITQKLTIIDELDLSIQEVSLNSPIEGSAYGYKKIKFQWTELHNATSYRIIIMKDSWTGDQVFLSETIYDTISKTLDENKYVWGVIGINDISESQPQKKSFYIDLTAPSKPVLSKPDNNSTITGTSSTLEWAHSTTDATTISDSLYIAKDNTFSQANMIEKLKLNTSSYFFINTAYKGSVYWRVKSIDMAGNKSLFSDIFSFTLQ